MRILTLNAGSSSLKASLFELQAPPPVDALAPTWEAAADWSEDPPQLTIRHNGGQQTHELAQHERDAIVRAVLAALWQGHAPVDGGPAAIDVVGQRVVQGGERFTRPTRITPEVKRAIADLAPYAPEHNPQSLADIAAVEDTLGETPQVAVFDTAFHQTMPLPAIVYPGPYAWYAQGLRRFGFHGLSHQYAAERAAQIMGRRVEDLNLVTCHLGSGVSLAAVQHGASVDTTMGFTPLEGLMMRTRSGSVDPGLLLFLQRHNGQSADDVSHTLNNESGLLGIGGYGGDMRAIEEALARGDERAALAFAIFIHRLRKGIAEMAAVMGGADGIVFTGGIGEHSAPVRQAACEQLRFMGIEIDPARNAALNAEGEIAAEASRTKIIVVQAREDWMIARACWDVMQPVP